MEANKQEMKKKKDRSTPYPYLTLKDAVSSIQEIEEKLGKVPTFRIYIAKALGHSKLTGQAIRKIAALTYFGLLDRNGDVYTISRLSHDILHPTSEEEKIRAIKKAAKSPNLFLKMVNQFQNQSLPTHLGNIFIREGIGNNAAQDVVSIFTQTLEFAGLLKNGVVIDDGSVQISDRENDSESGKRSLMNEAEERGTQMHQKASSAHSFVDSGMGWSLSIKSTKPLTSEVKKKLIDIAELLEAANKDQGD